MHLTVVRNCLNDVHVIYMLYIVWKFKGYRKSFKIHSKNPKGQLNYQGLDWIWSYRYLYFFMFWLNLYVFFFSILYITWLFYSLFSLNFCTLITFFFIITIFLPFLFVLLFWAHYFLIIKPHTDTQLHQFSFYIEL